MVTARRGAWGARTRGPGPSSPKLPILEPMTTILEPCVSFGSRACTLRTGPRALMLYCHEASDRSMVEISSLACTPALCTRRWTWSFGRVERDPHPSADATSTPVDITIFWLRMALRSARIRQCPDRRFMSRSHQQQRSQVQRCNAVVVMRHMPVGRCTRRQGRPCPHTKSAAIDHTAVYHELLS